MRRNILSLRVDLCQIDPSELKGELDRICSLMVSGVVEQSKTIAPVYTTTGAFIGTWTLAMGSDVPDAEMTTLDNPRR